ncbi:hypothetical protein JR316_0000253 [Psilocybe cubensis]|uniref:Uncharacterized protein n=2 Tax=Psilocybe cubensis TaxID=181762 RepID=A0A8H7Y4I1_PSICU|nr:hypothetical protein JR316_0000253 [Psilocybe cubensis]KAH9486189.1 hypothetical protein JR316_0000253 [Psilocybe cubensis]
MVAKLVCFCVTLLLLIGFSSANTEIINFSVAEDDELDLPFTETWPIFYPGHSQAKFEVTSAKLGTVLSSEICPDLPKWSSKYPQRCPHETWVVLDLDRGDWKRFNKFTLRVSWAAFHPTDFSIKVHDPTALAIHSQRPAGISSTRRKYARIQLVHAGVLTPPHNDTLDAMVRQLVPFVLTVEPLHLGIIPESVIPVIAAIMLAIVLGLPLSAWVYTHLLSIAKQAKLATKVD